MPPLVQSILEGNRLSLARLLTQVENNTPESRSALAELFPHTGSAHLIGVTGAPGTGKSSLVNFLARAYRMPVLGAPRRVAVVAVDPTSPFSGGAILGDRVRMRDLAGDSGVFIRSMASRGSLGGLAVATAGVVDVLDAAGFEIILIETVGAGQAEVDIARLAHTTLVVEAPGMGDEIQAIKAGILEIADVLVVNKADRPGVEATERALRSMLDLAHPVRHVFGDHTGFHSPSQPPGAKGVEGEQMLWMPPVLRTVATEGQGVAQVVDAIARHYRYLLETGELKLREQARLKAELDLLLRETLVRRWWDSIAPQEYDQVLQRLVQREISPAEAVSTLTGRAE